MTPTVLLAIAALLGIALDIVFGEPKHLHPLVGFGRCAKWLEKRLNRYQHRPSLSVAMGCVAWSVLILPPVVLLVVLMLRLDAFNTILLNALVMYFCIGFRSLREHMLAICEALKNDDLAAARNATARVVSRDTEHLSHPGIRAAAIESTLENGADAVFAPLFWGILVGAPAVLAYRLMNTLDAMWGYRQPRFVTFGRWAARADDWANFIPARLVACTYAVCGNRVLAFKAWRTQAHLCASPNAGPVMAAGTGALGVRVGGNAIYNGESEMRPQLGLGNVPDDHDILRAIYLVDKSLLLWCALLAIGGGWSAVFVYGF